MLNKKQIVDTFLELVRIDSPSGEEKKVASYIIAYLKKLKVKATRDKYGNVIVSLPGIGEPFFLSAHMDTVEPGCGIKPIQQGDIIKTDGSTVLGADDKAGIAAILELVRYYQNNKKQQHRPLEIIFTREEEIGCVGAQKANLKNIKAKEGLVLDSCRKLGNVMISSPYIYVLEIEVKGKSAHAGSFPEKGINAIQVAAKAIAELKWGRINTTTTSNMGIVKGGVAMNTVPDYVYMKGDARSRKLANAQKRVDEINKVFKKHVRQAKAKLNFKAKLICEGYDYKRSDSLIKRIAEMNKSLGLKTNYERGNGASDANIFKARGIKTIDISYGGSGVHTVREKINSKELLKLMEFLIEIVFVK